MSEPEERHLTRMGRVYDFIQDHLAEDLSIGRLAEVAYLSPWHFQRVFLAFSGESAAAFVRRLRVERAANLLMMQKTSTVDAVAAECGFGSAELLARHFRSRFHISPSGWRSASREERRRTIRQALGTNGGAQDTGGQDSGSFMGYVENQPPRETISALRLERRAERKVIYTRHFQGYDHGIAAAWKRLWHWAEPRGLIRDDTVRIGMGLDNPWITPLDRCRFLCCLTVKEFPEVGEGIGTRTIPEGLYASVEYAGPAAGLSWVYHHVYASLIPQAGVEAVDDLDYLEYLSTRPSFDREDYRCRLVLRVRSL